MKTIWEPDETTTTRIGNERQRNEERPTEERGRKRGGHPKGEHRASRARTRLPPLDELHEGARPKQASPMKGKPPPSPPVL